jgi:putative redox protein
MYARTKEWDLGDVSVGVDYDHRSVPRRFAVTVTLTGDLTEEQLARLEKVSATCPVRRSIEGGAAFDDEIVLVRARTVALR